MLYENAAWLSPPPSLQEITNDYTNIFTVPVSFDSDISLSESAINRLNGYDFDAYLKMSELSNELEYVNGSKTLSSGGIMQKVLAKTYNSQTLRNLVTKSTPQDLVNTNIFNQATNLSNIFAADVLRVPLVDGLNLTSVLSSNIENLIAEVDYIPYNLINHNVTTFPTIL